MAFVIVATMPFLVFVGMAISTMSGRLQVKSDWLQLPRMYCKLTHTHYAGDGFGSQRQYQHNCPRGVVKYQARTDPNRTI